MADVESILRTLNSDARQGDDWGQVAQYIPQLADVDPAQFAISVALADGRLLEAGDCHVPFSVQSITKIFTLAIALGRSGDQLWTRVGREPSGRAFNSIVQLEQEDGRPRNPFINAGAIVTTDEVLGTRTPREALGEIIAFVRAAAGSDDIYINDAVAASETAYRVGIPGKSGVGGGILAIVPGQASIAVWSPGLNRYGNSHKGTEALAQLTTAMNWSIF